MAKSKVIIMAGGKEERWGNHLGVHKHLLSVDGERLINRIVRLVTERMDVEIEMVAFHAEYDISGVRRYAPIRLDQQNALTGGAVSSVPYWSIDSRTTVLYGDVFFTERAMDRICSANADECTFIGREHASKLTGCPWGELFGFTLLPRNHPDVLKAIEQARNAYRQGTTQRCTGWEIYRALHDIPLTEHRVTRGFLDINDFTEDFDYPADFHQWLKRYQAWEQRVWWNWRSWLRRPAA